MAPLQSAVTNTSVVKGWQLESGGIINQGTGANIAAVTTTAWAWARRNKHVISKEKLVTDLSSPPGLVLLPEIT